MQKAKLTSKGQITLPVEIRTAMGLKPGEKVVFFEGPNGEFTMRRVGSILDLEGSLAGLVDLPKTDEEMNQMLHRRAFELDEATKSSARQASDSEAA
jgi:AbrB family looped-hinge helix DNA binding protein